LFQLLSGFLAVKLILFEFELAAFEGLIAFVELFRFQLVFLPALSTPLFALLDFSLHFANQRLLALQLKVNRLLLSNVFLGLLFGSLQFLEKLVILCLK